MTVAELPKRHASAWARATQHPFLEAVRDGSLSSTAFDTWLVQDYRFVSDLLRFQARLLARAARPAQPVLAAGVTALVDELAWFERQAGTRGLDLGSSPLQATLAYARLLERLDGEDLAPALVALWAIERVYLDAWTHAAPGAPAFAEFVAHWSAPEFGTYVNELQAAADEALRHRADDVDHVFAEVVEAESRFWDMAWSLG